MKEYCCHNCNAYIAGEINECPECGTRIYKKRDLISRPSLKKRAWKIFSDYIRIRDCIHTTGTANSGICYTCRRRLDISELQAGHLHPGRTYSVLFDENNVKAQCRSCNVFNNGEQGIFALRRVRELVEDGMRYEDALLLVEEYLRSSNTRAPMTNSELCNIIREYTRKTNELLSGGSYDRGTDTRQ